MLDQKLAEARSKKDTLKARAKSAQASKQISDMVQGLNTSTAMAAFDKMEEKVMALEAESEATLQVCPCACCGSAVMAWHALVHPEDQSWSRVCSKKDAGP